MHVVQIVLRAFGGELSATHADARRSWSTRQGLVLELRDGDGRLGVGEASPLPGFSVETFEQARLALEALPPSLELDLGDDPRAWIASLPFMPTIASARFALETALLDLLGQLRGQPAHRLWSTTGEAITERLPCAMLLGPAAVGTAGVSTVEVSAAAVSTVEVSAAAVSTVEVSAAGNQTADLLRDGDRLLQHAEEAVSRGASCVKVKVGLNVARDAAAIRRLRERLRPSVAIRLDANAAFSPSEAQRFLDAIADLDCELIEDPTALAAVHELRTRTPIALDECLLEANAYARAKELMTCGHVQLLVLKPMALGGWTACTELANLAHASGARVVFSHLLDGPIGRAAAAELALAIGDGLAQGLGAHGALGSWPEWSFAATNGLELVAHDEPGLGHGGELG